MRLIKIMDRVSWGDIFSLFETETFKYKIMNNHIIENLLNGLIGKSIYLTEYTDESIERHFFFSYFNVLPERKYENPYAKDLDTLHELLHMATLPHISVPQETWTAAIVMNETMVTAITETFVYFIAPELRSSIHRKEIYYDRVIEEFPWIKSMPLNAILSYLTQDMVAIQDVEGLENACSPYSERIYKYGQNSYMFCYLLYDDFMRFESCENKELFLNENVFNNKIVFESNLIKWNEYLSEPPAKKG